jgi:hypothetical protein
MGFEGGFMAHAKARAAKGKQGNWTGCGTQSGGRCIRRGAILFILSKIPLFFRAVWLAGEVGRHQ